MGQTWDEMKKRMIKNPIAQVAVGMALVAGYALWPSKPAITQTPSPRVVDLSKDADNLSEFGDQVIERIKIHGFPDAQTAGAPVSPQQSVNTAAPPIPAARLNEYEARAVAIHAEIKTADKQKFFDAVQLARTEPNSKFIAGNRLFAIYAQYKQERHVTTAAEDAEVSRDFTEATSQSYELFLQEYRGIAKQTFTSAKGVMDTLSKKEGELSSDERKKLAGCAVAFSMAIEGLKATGDLTEEKAGDLSILATAALNRSGLEISDKDQLVHLAQTCP